MYRWIGFLVCFLILGNCANFQDQKTIRFKDGRAATVFFDIHISESGEKVFVVDFQNDLNVRKESEVERDVFEIWKNLKRESDDSEADEGVIKYIFSTGETDGNGKRVYEGLIFAADRMENGEWTIKRVD